MEGPTEVEGEIMTKGQILYVIMDMLNDQPDVDRVHMEVDLEAMATNVIVQTDGRHFTVTVTEV